MKLRSGKIVSLNPNSALCQVENILDLVISELKQNTDALKSLLKDDPLFLKKIVELSLVLGKEIYSNQIQELVIQKYPNYTGDLEGHDALLLKTVSDFGRLICGETLPIKKELLKLPVKLEDGKQWQLVRQALRSKTEEQVRSIFLDSTMEDHSLVDTMGSIEFQCDEMTI